jgi:TPR repeat protein
MPQDVFISYSSKDKAVADAACAKLESAGIRCWVAPRDILPGDDWSESIVRAIDSSRIMVLIFSGHANNSEQIKRELNRAVSKALIIMPFRIEAVPMSKSLEFYVGTPHWLDALTPPLEKHLDYLSESVRLQLSHKGPDELPQSILTLTQKAESGDTDAMVNVGLAYQQGRVVQQDYEASTRWYRKAAELGHPMGMNNYAYALQEGHGVDSDPEQAVSWYEKAIAQDNTVAMSNLAGMYRNGSGVERDVHKAIELWNQAVEQNDRWAIAHLGYLHLIGDVVDVDIERARELFHRGAKLGDESCMYNIGTLYENGQGCERDEIQAVDWYRRAASKGYALAQERLTTLGYTS